MKPQSDDEKTNIPAPFTQDETIVQQIGSTTYVLTVKYKQDATESLTDKLLRLVENADEEL